MRIWIKNVRGSIYFYGTERQLKRKAPLRGFTGTHCGHINFCASVFQKRTGIKLKRGESTKIQIEEVK